MGKIKVRIDPPTPSFPYRISRRLNVLSVPRIPDDEEVGPALTPSGVRKSALRARISDRINAAAYPYLWRLLLLKRMYSKQLGPERVERINRILEAANSTIYARLANSVIQLRKEQADKNRKKWSDTDWRKHMDYINHIAYPKKPPEPEEIPRGPKKPLEDLLPRINEIAVLPEFRQYRPLDQDPWYKDPMKVSPAAKTYVPTERTRELAKPRKSIHAAD